MVYELRRNTTNSFLNDVGEDGEKEDQNVYLKVSHWNFLDKLAVEENKSRNQVLRDLLDREMKDRGGSK